MQHGEWQNSRDVSHPYLLYKVVFLTGGQEDRKNGRFRSIRHISIGTKSGIGSQDEMKQKLATKTHEVDDTHAGSREDHTDTGVYWHTSLKLGNYEIW